MHRSGRLLVPVVLLMLVFTLPLQAEGLKKIAQTGMKWFSIPMGSRPAAMGSAYTAVADDAGSIFWNPAGIAFSQGKHVYLNQTQWIADITVNSGAATWSSDRFGAFAVSFAAVDWGELHGTQRANNDAGFVETGTFSPTDYAIGIGYAKRVSNQFAFGGHLKYVNEELGSSLEGKLSAPKEYTAKMDLMAFDFGTIYNTGFKSLIIGMTLQNFSEEAQYRSEQFPLPLTFKFGLAMDVTDLWMAEDSPHRLLLAVDAIHPRDYSERLHFGLEYGYRDLFFLRGGYKSNYDEEDLSFGAGLKYEISGLEVALDYSYLQFKNFDAVQMFSFDFKF
jgi:hypothetical protein